MTTLFATAAICLLSGAAVGFLITRELYFRKFWDNPLYMTMRLWEEARLRYAHRQD